MELLHLFDETVCDLRIFYQLLFGRSELSIYVVCFDGQLSKLNVLVSDLIIELIKFTRHFVNFVLFYVSELLRREERPYSKSFVKDILPLLLVYGLYQMMQVDRFGHVLFCGNLLIECLARQVEVLPLLGKSEAETLLYVQLTFGIIQEHGQGLPLGRHDTHLFF